MIIKIIEDDVEIDEMLSIFLLMEEYIMYDDKLHHIQSIERYRRL